MAYSKAKPTDYNLKLGRKPAQVERVGDLAVRLRSLGTQGRVRSQDNQCGFGGGQCGTRADFSRSRLLRFSSVITVPSVSINSSTIEGTQSQ
jgi:hypothetical protein